MLLSPPVNVGGGTPLAGTTPPVGRDGTIVVLSWCYRATGVLSFWYRNGPAGAFFDGIKYAGGKASRGATPGCGPRRC